MNITRHSLNGYLSEYVFEYRRTRPNRLKKVLPAYCHFSNNDIFNSKLKLQKNAANKIDERFTIKETVSSGH